MKKITAMIAVLAILFCAMSACGPKTYEDGYVEGYDDGYPEGFDAGYYEGIARAQKYIAFVVDDDLWHLGRDIEKECGMHPGEAVEVLTNYVDVPDEVTEEELYAAIMAIHRYYHDSNKLINGIDDYNID